MKLKSEAGYNERLFAGGVRQRFQPGEIRVGAGGAPAGGGRSWVRGALLRAGARCQSVLELGCFDGRAVSYLPHRPDRYLGLDANWEGGLDLARERAVADPSLEFCTCTTPDELRTLTRGRRSDTAICLETLEHVPPERVSGYLEAISEVLDGYIAITVPNEKGPVFLAKYLVKRAVGEVPEYRLAEIGAATIGRMDRVEVGAQGLRLSLGGGSGCRPLRPHRSVRVPRPGPPEDVGFRGWHPGSVAGRGYVELWPVTVEHVGSTAVPGLCAKPVIDLLVGRPPKTDVDPVIEGLKASVHIIESNGGVLSGEAVSLESGKPIRQYWIDLLP